MEEERRARRVTRVWEVAWEVGRAMEKAVSQVEGVGDLWLNVEQSQSVVFYSSYDNGKLRNGRILQ